MQQFTLNIPPSDQYKIEDFIVSKSNKLAYDTMTDWQTTWGVKPYEHTVLLLGPKYCGKTFLTRIFQNLSNAHVINQDISYDIINSHNNFIIEDIGNYDEQTLLHYFNLINENKKHLLLTSTQNCFTPILPDLSSRINSLLTIELLEPDQELIKILLFKIFSNNSIKLDNKILEFLSNRLPRNFYALLNITEKIINYSLTQKRRVTIPLLKEMDLYC